MIRSAAALSEHPVAAYAVGEVAGSVLEALGPEPDVAIAFVEAHHTGAMDDIAAALAELLRPGALIASTACGVIGGDREIEDLGAISLWAAAGLDATAFRIAPGAVEPDPSWSALDADAAVLLSDPFSVDLQRVLDDAAHARPSLSLHGGLASAAMAPGGNRLVLDGDIHTDGAVGIALRNVSVRSIVAQGCRPVGDPFVITGVQGNVVTELGSKPPLQRLESMVAAASDDERARLGGGLTVGLVIDEAKPEHDTGDFLIRSLLGADRSSGALAIGAEVPIGTTLQFHVRDAEAASADLNAHLDRLSEPAHAALVFTCNGRGRHLFGPIDHDADAIHHRSGSNATAGMFCAGEIGPVGGRNHVHGFTASTLLFEA